MTVKENKYQKSLNRIKKNLFPSDSWTDEDKEHYFTIVEALEKQVPKKIEKQKWMDTVCGCGRVFSKHHGDGYHTIPYENQTKYCPECGQALDWEEGESDA